MIRSLKVDNYLIIALVLTFVTAYLIPGTVLSEDQDLNSDQRSLGTVKTEELPETSSTPTSASDASFDKRLPPVLPGEIINDSGKTMKVWSTTGPVPVSDAPEPWKKEIIVEKSGDSTGVNIIIDRRRDRKR